MRSRNHCKRLGAAGQLRLRIVPTMQIALANPADSFAILLNVGHCDCTINCDDWNCGQLAEYLDLKSTPIAIAMAFFADPATRCEKCLAYRFSGRCARRSNLAELATNSLATLASGNCRSRPMRW